jgi:hypothetical protein
MQFYVLDHFPSGDAETCASKETGYNLGDAPACPACGSAVGMLSWLPPFRVVLKLYGKEFGDFAFMGASNDFLVSQRFRDEYQRQSLTGLTGFDPVEVIRVKSRKKKRPEPPPYLRVGVSYGQPALDMPASGFEWLEPPTCPVCRTGNIIRWKRLVLESGTWTGEDAFRPRGLSGTIMVTERFKHACEEHQIKNAIFTPAEAAGHDFYPGLTDPSELNRFSR